MMTLQRESLNQPSSHLLNRNEAVAVTAPTVALPSGFRRAVEIGGAQLLGRRGQPGAVLDRALVDALARSEDATREIDHGADLERRQLLGRRRQLQVHGLEG